MNTYRATEFLGRECNCLCLHISKDLLGQGLCFIYCGSLETIIWHIVDAK